MRRAASLHIVLSLLLTAVGRAQRPATAEQGYDMRGLVMAPDGSAIRNAQVRVVGVDAFTSTNDSGRFSIDRLPGGTRVVEIRALGFSPQLLPVGIGATTPFLFVHMERLTILDSVRVVAVNGSEFARKHDIIGERELEAPEILGGSVLNAVQLLRPQLLNARGPTSFFGGNESARRGQLYARAEDGGGPAATMAMPTSLVQLTTSAGSMSVSVNEGPPQSPDVMAILPARRIREIRFLRPLEATARFGSSASSGPVLVIYTK